jgi:hypothetical protein
MKSSGIAVAVAFLVAAGCSSDDTSTPSASSVVPTDMPACDEVYAEGNVIDNEFGLACVLDDELVSPRPVRLECGDGRILVFNDLAWGYDGEGMTITPEDDPSKMPEEAVDECIVGAPGASATDAAAGAGD